MWSWTRPDCAVRTQLLMLFSSSVSSSTTAIKPAETIAGRIAREDHRRARKATTKLVNQVTNEIDGGNRKKTLHEQ